MYGLTDLGWEGRCTCLGSQRQTWKVPAVSDGFVLSSPPSAPVLPVPELLLKSRSRHPLYPWPMPTTTPAAPDGSLKMDSLLLIWLLILGVMAVMTFAGVFILLIPAIENQEAQQH